MWTWALRKMPWKTLLVHAPTIVDAARNFYATSRSPTTDGTSHGTPGNETERLRRAVEELEARAGQQAALLADLAKQAQALAAALDVLRARVLVALVAATVALVLAVATTGVLLWR